MLDIRRLRLEPEAVRDALVKRDPELVPIVEHVLSLDKERREGLMVVNELKAERNTASKQVGELKRKGEDAGELVAAMRVTGDKISKIDDRIRTIDQELQDLLLAIPNTPLDEVPEGGEEENRTEKIWGDPTTFDFEPLPHWDLGTGLDILDLTRGSKISGSGFSVLKGMGARLQRGLINYFLDVHTGEHGYTEVRVPYLVTREAMVGTGQLPKFEEESYVTTRDDLWLIPTAEVPITNLHKDELLSGMDLPVRYAGYSPCFRREAGAAGKDTRGLLRMHQFDKVEQVVLCKNDIIESKGWHEKILSYAEQLLQELKLPYRVVDVCTGELGQGQVAKFDIETWMPSRESYGETHSASRFYDFQARRLNVRYRDGQGKVQFCHSLNNTVIASPRILIPLMELYQNPDGSICIPKALTPYMNGMEKIDP